MIERYWTRLPSKFKFSLDFSTCGGLMREFSFCWPISTKFRKASGSENMGVHVGTEEKKSRSPDE